MSRRLRIALVAHEIHDRGGMERAFAELVRRIHSDYDVVVVSRALAPELRPLVEWRRIRVPRRPAPLTFPLFFALAAIELARTRTDLVHTLGAIVPNHSDVSSVHFCHAGLFAATGQLAPPDAPLLRRLNTSLARMQWLVAERWYYRSGRVRALTAVSSGLAAELERYYPASRVTVAPNGVDVRRFRPDEEARCCLRAEQNVPSEAVIFLFVGGDWDRKGLAVAIEGLAYAVHRSPHRLELWIVGAGNRKRFSDLASRLGVAASVRFFGPRPDTERFYQAADALVLPTTYETFGLVAFEAAASGLPLVATPVNGVREFLGEEVAGLQIERTGASAGSALVRLSADPELRRRLGAQARTLALQYPWERPVDEIRRIYERLAAATPVPAVGTP